MSAGCEAFDRLFGELQNRAILLEADAVLPSVARMVIGGPYKGSWWAHPQSNRIYMLSKDSNTIGTCCTSNSCREK